MIKTLSMIKTMIYNLKSLYVSIIPAILIKAPYPHFKGQDTEAWEGHQLAHSHITANSGLRLGPPSLTSCGSCCRELLEGSFISHCESGPGTNQELRNIAE